MSMPLIEKAQYSGSVASVGLVVFIAVHAALAAQRGELSDQPVLSIIDLCLLSLAGLCLIAPVRELAPASIAAVVVGCAGLSLLLVGIVTPIRDPSAVHPIWQLDAFTLVLCVLVLRGRKVIAWLAMAFIVGCMLASAATGPNLWAGLDVVSRPIIVLMLCTVFVCLLCWLLERSAREATRQREQFVRTEAQLAAQAARRSAANRLREQAGELLELIARQIPLSPAERTECLVVEGALRDSARSPRLSAEPLVGAVRLARSRNTDVVLLDDGSKDSSGDSDAQAIVEWMTGIVSLGSPTHIVGRIAPPERDFIASLVITDDGVTTTHTLTR